MGLLRRLLLFKLGALLGMVLAAALAKRVVPSRGDAESDELALVAILDGVELESRAKAFTGGSLLAWFGGIELDLSEAELGDGARLSVHAVFGGVEITIPPTWRVESSAKAIMGGIDAPSGNRDDPSAPVLTVDGMAVFGGIEIRPSAGAPARGD